MNALEVVCTFLRFSLPWLKPVQHPYAPAQISYHAELEEFKELLKKTDFFNLKKEDEEKTLKSMNETVTNVLFSGKSGDVRELINTYTEVKSKYWSYAGIDLIIALYIEYHDRLPVFRAETVQLMSILISQYLIYADFVELCNDPEVRFKVAHAVSDTSALYPTTNE